MTQLDDLAFCLLAAGGAQDPESSGTYLLYIDAETSSLVLKLWAGGDVEKLGPAEIVAESVRPNSTASYIIESSIRIIAYISSDNKLRVCEFDDESDEWFDDKTIPQCKVHLDGHVAAVCVPNDQMCIIFQDPSKRFNLFNKIDGSWTSTILPVEPTAGSPIGTFTVGDQLHIFYVSAKDNCLHYVVKDDGSNWKDVTAANCLFNEKSKPKRFLVLPGLTSENRFQVFAMSEKNTLWQFAEASEKLRKLGNMDGNKFEPDDSEECFFKFTGSVTVRGCTIA